MKRDSIGSQVNWYGEFSNKQIEHDFIEERWPDLSSRISKIAFFGAFFYILAGISPFFLEEVQNIALRLIILRTMPIAGAILIYITSHRTDFNRYLPYSLAFFIILLGLFESYEAVITYAPNLEYNFPLTLLIILFIYLLFPYSFKAVSSASIFSSIAYITALGLWAPPAWMDLIQLTMFFLFTNILGIYLFIEFSKNRRCNYQSFKEIEILNKKLNLEIAEKNKANKQLEKLADTDELTSAANRRKFNNRLEFEFSRAFRYERPLSLLMLDIDYFKKINDTHGHDAGDKVLSGFVKHCQAELRDSDLLSRIGGEEFAVILPETSESGAFELAERIRCRIGSAEFKTEAESIRITSSCGLSSLSLNSFKTSGEMIKAADEALYTAKGSGRNRTCCSAVI